MLILGLYLLCGQLSAQPSSGVCMDSAACLPERALFCEGRADSLFVIVGEFITPVIFDVNKYDIRTTPQLEEVIDFVVNNKNMLTQIWVQGSASPEGALRWNQKLGQYRADALANYIAKNAGLDCNRFRIYNLGEDWSTLESVLTSNENFPNRVRILEILSKEKNNEIRKQKIQELDGGKTWRLLITELFPPLRNARLAMVATFPKLSPIAPGMVMQTQLVSSEPPLDWALSVPVSVSNCRAEQRSNWKIAVKNNLFFDLALVANLGVEISPWSHWSLDIPIWYSPYNITSIRNIRLLAAQPEIRWWPKEAMSGHFIGLHTHVAGFNVALNDHTRYQDPNHALWGVGLSYGYAISLGKSEHWGLEFNIGVGFAKYQYDAYRNWSNGPKFESGSGCYWGITRAGVTLSYKWDLSRKSPKR